MWCLPLILWWPPYTFHFFVVILNRTINLSTSKLPVQVNKAQLSNQSCFSFFISFWLRREPRVWWQETLCCLSFFPLSHIWIDPQNDTYKNQTDVLQVTVSKKKSCKKGQFCNFLKYNDLESYILLNHDTVWLYCYHTTLLTVDMQ